MLELVAPFAGNASAAERSKHTSFWARARLNCGQSRLHDLAAVIQMGFRAEWSVGLVGQPIVMQPPTE
jgi:hypothetical protein